MPASASAACSRSEFAQAYSGPRTPRRWRTSISRRTSACSNLLQEGLAVEVVDADRRHLTVGRSPTGLPCPLEDAQRAERVPPARLAVALVQLEVDPPRMGVLQQPAAVGILLAAAPARPLPRCGGPDRHRSTAGSRARGARRRSSGSDRRTAEIPGRRSRRSTCAGTGRAREGTARRAHGAASPARRQSPARTRAAPPAHRSWSRTTRVPSRSPARSSSRRPPSAP